MWGMVEEVVCCCMVSWLDGVFLVEDAFVVEEEEEQVLEPENEASSGGFQEY